VSRYFKHATILTVVPAVFMPLVAGGCLLIAQRPGAFVWVVVVSFSAAAVCPLLSLLALLRITHPKVSLFDLIICAAVSLLAAVLFNVALKSGVQAPFWRCRADVVAKSGRVGNGHYRISPLRLDASPGKVMIISCRQ
jgi:hypothetical protein